MCAQPKLTEHQITVLLIDDQPIVGETVRRLLLGEPDIAFHYCKDAARALEVAGKVGPTVILQDLVMPEIDGLTLVKMFRANDATRETPLIVLSAKEEPTTKAEAFGLGANDYLVKLPDRIELIARIRYHSTAYLSQLQRDEAYRALRESQQRLMETNLELQRLTNVDGLTGLVDWLFRSEQNRSLFFQTHLLGELGGTDRRFHHVAQWIRTHYAGRKLELRFSSASPVQSPGEKNMGFFIGR